MFRYSAITLSLSAKSLLRFVYVYEQCGTFALTRRWLSARSKSSTRVCHQLLDLANRVWYENRKANKFYSEVHQRNQWDKLTEYLGFLKFLFAKFSRSSLDVFQMFMYIRKIAYMQNPLIRQLSFSKFIMSKSRCLKPNSKINKLVILNDRNIILL